MLSSVVFEGLISHISFCVALLGVFLFIYFLTSGNNQNRWLGLLNLTLAIHFLNIFLLHHDVVNTFFGLSFGLIYGPIIFFFARAYTEEKDRHILWHILPSFLLAVWIIIKWYTETEASLIELTLFQIVVFLQLAIYIFLAYSMLVKYARLAVHSRSVIDSERINILRGTVLFVCLAFFLSVTETYLMEKSESIASNLILPSFLLVSQLLLIYKGMMTAAFFSSINSEEKRIAQDIRKYVPAFTEDQNRRYKEILLKVMEEHKPYKQEMLSLHDLSEVSKIPVRDLSQFINGEFKKNYFEFINTYRIEEAKTLLRNKSKRVSEVMYEVGFSSRSSFNTFFRKQTGMTPSQYRKKLV